MVVEFFSQSDKTLKVSKNQGFRWRWLILFCSRDEPPETNEWVKLRVITFKLLHWKGFYSAHFPEVTKKFALYSVSFYYINNL